MDETADIRLSDVDEQSLVAYASSVYDRPSQKGTFLPLIEAVLYFCMTLNHLLVILDVLASNEGIVVVFSAFSRMLAALATPSIEAEVSLLRARNVWKSSKLTCCNNGHPVSSSDITWSVIFIDY